VRTAYQKIAIVIFFVFSQIRDKGEKTGFFGDFLRVKNLKCAFNRDVAFKLQLNVLKVVRGPLRSDFGQFRPWGAIAPSG